VAPGIAGRSSEREPATPRRRLPITGVLLAALATIPLAGCKKPNAYVAPPPPSVGIVRPVARQVTPFLEATGSVVAYNAADLVARVDGFVESIDYKDGDVVKAGQTLFVIEPGPYQAKLQQAQSAVAAAEAQVAQTDAEFARLSSLGRNDFASRSAIDQARANRDVNQANLASQQAGLALAKINLGYTNVMAPFAGMVSQHLVSTGALVGVGGPTKLASIVQFDPINISIRVSEQDVQRVRANMAKGGRETLAELGPITVLVGLMTEDGYPHQGVLDYADPQVDPATGTLLIRAVLDNKLRVLLPGYFVRVRIQQTRSAVQALLVPDAALGSSQAGQYLLTVNKDDEVEQRSVRTGTLDGTLRVIESGLQPDDRVIVSGLARAVPGQKVAPKPAAGF
jgi:RND family efflux transporter MFP subunit